MSGRPIHVCRECGEEGAVFCPICRCFFCVPHDEYHKKSNKSHKSVAVLNRRLAEYEQILTGHSTPRRKFPFHLIDPQTFKIQNEGFIKIPLLLVDIREWDSVFTLKFSQDSDCNDLRISLAIYTDLDGERIKDKKKISAKSFLLRVLEHPQVCTFVTRQSGRRIRYENVRFPDFFSGRVIQRFVLMFRMLNVSENQQIVVKKEKDAKKPLNGRRHVLSSLDLERFSEEMFFNINTTIEDREGDSNSRNVSVWIGRNVTEIREVGTLRLVDRFNSKRAVWTKRGDNLNLSFLNTEYSLAYPWESIVRMLNFWRFKLHPERSRIQKYSLHPTRGVIRLPHDTSILFNIKSARTRPKELGSSTRINTTSLESFELKQHLFDISYGQGNIEKDGSLIYDENVGFGWIEDLGQLIVRNDGVYSEIFHSIGSSYIVRFLTDKLHFYRFDPNLRRPVVSKSRQHTKKFLRAWKSNFKEDRLSVLHIQVKANQGKFRRLFSVKKSVEIDFKTIERMPSGKISKMAAIRGANKEIVETFRFNLTSKYSPKKRRTRVLTALDVQGEFHFTRKKDVLLLSIYSSLDLRIPLDTLDVVKETDNVLRIVVKSPDVTLLPILAKIQLDEGLNDAEEDSVLDDVSFHFFVIFEDPLSVGKFFQMFREYKKMHELERDAVQNLSTKERRMISMSTIDMEFESTEVESEVRKDINEVDDQFVDSEISGMPTDSESLDITDVPKTLLDNHLVEFTRHSGEIQKSFTFEYNGKDFDTYLTKNYLVIVSRDAYPDGIQSFDLTRERVIPGREYVLPYYKIQLNSSDGVYTLGDNLDQSLLVFKTDDAESIEALKEKMRKSIREFRFTYYVSRGENENIRLVLGRDRLVLVNNLKTEVDVPYSSIQNVARMTGKGRKLKITVNSKDYELEFKDPEAKTEAHFVIHLKRRFSLQKGEM